jgi:hypothetical protein
MFCLFSIGTQQAVDASNERFTIEERRFEERIHTVRHAKKAYVLASSSFLFSVLNGSKGRK